MPCKEKLITNQDNFVKFSIIIILLIISQLVLSQKLESVYMSEFNSGITIYTITNRTYEQTGENIKFLNAVSSDTVLTFLKISFYSSDSLHISPMKQENFLKEVSLIHDDWLLFVHGDSKTFEQAVMRGFDIQHFYDVHVLVFSWPSKDPDFNGIKNFKNSKKNVVRSFDHFNKLLRYVQKVKNSNPSFSQGSKISMFIHSLGNAYIENLAKQNQFNDSLNTLFDNIIINAAAVNQEAHKQWVEQLHFQKHIYIINNKQDFSLKGVRIFTKDGKQLGEVIDHPVADNANYVQFSEAVGFRTPTGTTHTYFIGEVADESVNIRNFYKEILHGQQPNLLNGNNFVKRKDGIGYDINF